MRRLAHMKNDIADIEGIIGLIIAIIILGFFIILFFPTMCHSMPPPSEAWAQTDICRFFR